jgi:hypothetical protein
VRVLLLIFGVFRGRNKCIGSAFKFCNPVRCRFVPTCLHNVEDSSQQSNTQKIAQSEEAELAVIAASEEKLLNTATRSELVAPENCNDDELAHVIRLDGVVRVNEVIEDGNTGG